MHETMQDNLRELVEIDEKIKSNIAELEELEKKRTMVEEALKIQFVEAGVQNVKALGKTIYLHRSEICSVSADTMPALVKVLDDEGVGHLAPRTITTPRVKSLLKEDEARWKAKFDGLIYSGEKFSIRTRSS